MLRVRNTICRKSGDGNGQSVYLFVDVFLLFDLDCLLECMLRCMVLVSSLHAKALLYLSLAAGQSTVYMLII